MFLGEYKHNVDQKGRLAVPKKFRIQLGTTSILTKGLDGCLFLYPHESWNELANSLKQLSITQADNRAFGRYLFGGASEVAFDTLGRIKIPDYLLAYAGIKKESVLVGMLNRVEIWSMEKWQVLSKDIEGKGEEIAEKLSGRGL